MEGRLWYATALMRIIKQRIKFGMKTFQMHYSCEIGNSEYLNVLNFELEVRKQIFLDES